jgi:tetratricopeptide (TPR) repeat protein
LDYCHLAMKANRDVWQTLHDKAISDYSKAIQLNPNNGDAYFNRGLIYSALRKYDKAIADFTEVISQLRRQARDNFEAYYNRGLAYAALRKYDKAISDYSEVILQREPPTAILPSGKAIGVHLTQRRSNMIRPT